MTGLIDNLKRELETPRGERPLGSGWLSGCGALACGITGIALVVSLRWPGLLAVPELEIVTRATGFRVFLHAVLILGYVFALLSLLLRANKVLGFTSLALVMWAGLIGSAPGGHAEASGMGVYFGLDFFILNVLFTGFVFIPLERIAPKATEQVLFRPEWDEDIFYYLVSSLIVQVATYMTFAPANFVSAALDLSRMQAYIAAQPFLLQLALIMLLSDLVQYWVHRAFHRVPFLWQFHAVHHSAKTMDWLAGARMHVLEVFVLRGLTAVPMLSFGFDPAAIQLYVLIVYFVSAFLHANIGWDMGPIERFIAGPRFHHWHHGLEPEAVDVNFAIHFPLIDWLFGTHHMPEGRWPRGYGVADHKVPRGYIPQLLHPFVWLRSRERKTGAAGLRGGSDAV